MAKKKFIEALDEGKYRYDGIYLTIPKTMSELSIDDDIFINLSGEMNRQKYRGQLEGETNEQYMDYLEFIAFRIKKEELYLVENKYKKLVSNLNI